MKPKDPVWGFYEVVTEGTKSKAMCKACSSIVSAKAERLRTHLQKCSKAVQDKKPPTSTPDVVCVKDIDCVVTAMDLSNDCVRKSTTLKRLRQTSMSYVIPTSDDTRVTLDEQIAKMFFAFNLPFNVVDNPVFRETIEMLRPGYKPPSRQDLLDSVHKKLTDGVKVEGR